MRALFYAKSQNRTYKDQEESVTRLKAQCRANKKDPLHGSGASFGSKGTPEAHKPSVTLSS